MDELSVSDHFRRLELMALKYAGGEFTTDKNGERFYRIALLEMDEETELYFLNERLEASHKKQSDAVLIAALSSQGETHGNAHPTGA